MNQPFGSWMLTCGTRGELHGEARQRQHVAVIRELRAEERAARRAARHAAISEALAGLKARFAGGTSATSPDCCPA